MQASHVVLMTTEIKYEIVEEVGVLSYQVNNSHLE